MDQEQRERYATVGTAFLGKVAQRLTRLDPDDIPVAQLPSYIKAARELQQVGQEHEDPASRRERVVAAQLLDTSSGHVRPHVYSCGGDVFKDDATGNLRCIKCGGEWQDA